MALKQELQQDLITAMKAKDEIRVSALRMVKAAILKFEVSGDRKEATDQDILTIIGKEVKQRKDSIEQFRAGNREDLIGKEEKELAVLQTYLPSQLSEEEITVIVKEVIASTGAKSKTEIGKVMGALMPRVKGRADGALVNKIVNSSLA